MAGNIVLRSYLDLVNGPLENTVNYSTSDRNPIRQGYSSLRRFTKQVGKLDGDMMSRASSAVGDYYSFVVPAAAHAVIGGLQNRMCARANGNSVEETQNNALVYHREAEWVKYVLDFGVDLPNPRYLAFFNLDDEPVYLCKAKKIEVPENSNCIYTLVPFLEVPAHQSIGQIIFNPRYGCLFCVSNNTQSDQDLYIVAYNA